MRYASAQLLSRGVFSRSLMRSLKARTAAYNFAGILRAQRDITYSVPPDGKGVISLKKCRYIVYPAIAVGVGALSGFLTRRAMKELFPLLDKPPLTPPPLVFPIVWTALYILMGVGMALVKNTDSLAAARSERLWWAQLAVNFIWTLVFFPAQAFLAALALLVLLFGLVAAMSAAFAKLNKPAAWLQLPYLLWLLVAGYLNAGIWLLNR